MSDNLALYELLQKHHKQLEEKIIEAKAKQTGSVGNLLMAQSEVERALNKVIGELAREAQEEEALQADLGAGELVSEDPAYPTDDTIVSDVEDPLIEQEIAADPALDEPKDVDPPTSVDKAYELAESLEDSPVAMSPKLRKAMSDPAADVMDAYAQKVFSSVRDYFEKLTQKALDLQTAADDKHTLREVLLMEVGRRGLANVEQNFAEWRESLIKSIWKEVTSMFETNKEVEMTEPVVSMDSPTILPPVSEVIVEEDATAPVEEPMTDAPVDEPEVLPLPVDASSKTVTASLRADFRPAGRKRVTLE